MRYAKKIAHLIQVGAYTTTSMLGGYRRGIPHREQVGQHLSTLMAGQNLGVGDTGFQLGQFIPSTIKENLPKQRNPVEWAMEGVGITSRCRSSYW